MWTTTARGMANVCLRRVEPAHIFRLIRDEKITMFCAADRADLDRQRPWPMRAEVARRAAVHSRRRPPPRRSNPSNAELGWELTHVRADGNIAVHHVLANRCLSMRAQQARPNWKARQGVELVSSGELRVVDGGPKCRATDRRSARSPCAAMS